MVDDSKIEVSTGPEYVDPGTITVPPSREEFDALKARVDAMAAHHLQTYGKAI